MLYIMFGDSSACWCRQITLLLEEDDRHAGEDLNSDRRRIGQKAMRSPNKAPSLRNRTAVNLVDIEIGHCLCRADKVDQRVNVRQFMEVHLLRLHAVDFGLGLDQYIESGECILLNA